ncbi:SURF1 family protein [Gallaecimonas kandeliae]|uniref:SURF1 family protein n=1 Tax=Gallaecimonas kandeliae TaxID=3029055 RepID=UPI00264786E9|nr:SURF1 family protein [Gallaecimonas kandeliae]WKE65838.1 SURF1 family protein [Gallaecimonas kandeliae]
MVPWLITMALLGLFCKLAWWQWQRAGEKEARLALMVSRPQLSLAEALNQAEPNDWPVRVRGRWLPQAVLWDNRTLGAKVGYDLLQPFETDEGTLLVDRGFLAAPEHRDQLPTLPLASGEALLLGHLRLPERGLLLGANSPEAIKGAWRIQEPLPADLAPALKLKLLPVVLNLGQGADGLVPHWAPVVMPPEKHRAYAVQWALMALALVVVFGFWLRKQRRAP